ncbi:phosphate-starvation-inducible PsiE family protein [Maribius pontilimi]|uniref:Phosphate-starvation-inducible PsiE family protein n=1 Tax=Palleronia pontilimi TaxID=1964209 RepID=A0A934I946_9RHOB|nr:phosphate-starvation-inducible PsiE family protein [Palleronia pontilimi]MBJ3762759.1 phosphate-starvation-inducible PsiE family protein [Palleronia pontilimi]
MSDRKEGPFLAVYTWFERVVSGVILLGMVGVVILATYSFLRTLVGITLAENATLDYVQFQTLFDRVLAAVIAVELAHSIRQMVAGDHGFGQLRTVISIGMLAVVRKLIVLEVDQATGGFLLGIAAAVAALAIGLVAIRWIENRRPD